MTRVFGLTGGIASGKSTVAVLWRARGLPVIDADQLARDVVRPGSPALVALVERFGRDILTCRGDLDRKRLGDQAFRDPEAREDLERIVHPRIAEASAVRIRQLEALGEPLACYEAALLVETGRSEAFRPLVVVVAPEALQVERAVQRGGLTESEVRARIASQLPLAEKAKYADWVLDNAGSPHDLRRRSDEVLSEVCAASGVAPKRYGLGPGFSTF